MILDILRVIGLAICLIGAGSNFVWFVVLNIHGHRGPSLSRLCMAVMLTAFAIFLQVSR